MIRFNAFGHKNIKATHKTTLEFTKANYLSQRGDCIVGIKADFKINEIKRFIKMNDKVKITVEVNGLEESIVATLNKDFSDNNEIVIRKSNFRSNRTLAIWANKAAINLDRDFVKNLKVDNQPLTVTLEGI